MAKRRGSASGAILVLAVFGLSLLGPFVIIGAWLYFETIAPKGASAVKAFIRRDEQIREQSDLQDRRKEIIATGDEAGLGRRTDGFFDGRSILGRELNAHIEAIDVHTDQISDALASQANDSAKLGAARTAVVVGLVSFAVSYFWFQLGLFLGSAASSGCAILAAYVSYAAQMKGSSARND